MTERMTAVVGPGEPDHFMVAAQSAAVRVAVRRLRVAALALLLALVGGLGVLLLWPHSWTITVPIALGVAFVGACCGFPPGVKEERPVPGTELEVARVLDCSVRTWGGSSDGKHRVRVTGEDSSGRLVHDEVWLEATSGCEAQFGALFGFRRHPTMRHLVHIEPQTEVRDLDRLDVQARIAKGWLPDAAEEAVATGTIATAQVTALGIGEDVLGPRSLVRLELRLADGTTITATPYLLPEELLGVAPGSTVRIARGRSLRAVLLGTPAWNRGLSA
ncbi:hypothetical protein [Nocardioides alcanivorans]|uniref:hypothetical protein n=1 Tax=Nocardioides alcanivorans TaxID=2897352 RepID=UPI001F2D9123|nr:hypothetical protein [Nocardioides alcanivorans]